MIGSALIAGCLSAVSDLGLGNEIESSRGLVWAWIVTTGLILSLCLEVRNLDVKIKGDETTQSEQEDKISELEQAKEELEEENSSLLRLMETYKTQAYDDIVEKLRLTLYAHLAMSRLSERGIRAVKAKIDSSKTVDNALLDVKMFHRATVIIDAGRSDGVMKGMQFEVVDTQTNQVYSIVRVSEVHNHASECSVESDYDKVFWSDVIKKLDSNSDGIVDLPGNKLAPLVSTNLSELDQEAAQQLITVLDNAVSANRYD